MQTCPPLARCSTRAAAQRVAQFMNGKANPVVVADMSCKMLSEARQKDGLRPVCSHTEKLPFADETFARILKVSPQSVSNWINAYIAKLPPAPKPQKPKVAELDELYTFLKQKKTRFTS